MTKEKIFVIVKGGMIHSVYTTNDTETIVIDYDLLDSEAFCPTDEGSEQIKEMNEDIDFFESYLRANLLFESY